MSKPIPNLKRLDTLDFVLITLANFDLHEEKVERICLFSLSGIWNASRTVSFFASHEIQSVSVGP